MFIGSEESRAARVHSGTASLLQVVEGKAGLWWGVVPAPCPQGVEVARGVPAGWRESNLRCPRGSKRPLEGQFGA